MDEGERGGREGDSTHRLILQLVSIYCRIIAAEAEAAPAEAAPAAPGWLFLANEAGYLTDDRCLGFIYKCKPRTRTNGSSPGRGSSPVAWTTRVPKTTARSAPDQSEPDALDNIYIVLRIYKRL